MPWYFYGKTGSLVTPRSPSVVAPGQIVVSVLPYTATPPEGYLFCNGQSLLKNDYLDLFSEIGTAFGSVDANHFTLPDMRSRFPRSVTLASAGIGAGPGTGGAASHTHTLPAHTHAVSTGAHTHSLPSHSHTIPNHTHPLSLVHKHGSGTLATGNPTPTRNDNDTDEDGPPYQWGTTEIHTHGGNVNGETGNVNSGADTTGSGGSASGPVSTLATGMNALTSTSGSGTSGSGGGGVSSSGSNLPPYFTCSYLIKT